MMTTSSRLGAAHTIRVSASVMGRVKDETVFLHSESALRSPETHRTPRGRPSPWPLVQQFLSAYCKIAFREVD